ncbi:MAG: HAD-IC family P-type ATPase [Bacteroidales bacterium]|nr:HAD-IC family P-type ATPase [Bacteroidales bacterium]
MILLGLAGIIDPPRDEAIEAIKACSEAGITVKMITGDHAATAKAIGKEMGIGDGEKALQGRDLEKMNDQELKVAAQEYDIFARTSPEHKLRLVEALQANGAICAMTGDGVNDAPALKKADVGIAMGIKGTEVTKEAAEMVLADDNFSTIVSAVEEGRRVYDNLKKTILFILPTNGAESFLIMASILFGTTIPLTPVQILWVNMVTSVTISLALAFENIEPDAMKRPPRSPKASLLNGYFIWRIIFVSLLIGGGTLAMNLDMEANGIADNVIKTVTLNTIVITQMFHLFNSRSISKFAFNKDFFSNKAVFVVSALLIVLQLGITYLPFMNNLFGTTPLKMEDWIYPVGMGIAVFVIVEIEKAIMNKLKLAKL